MIKKASTIEIKKAFFCLSSRQRSKLLEELEDKLYTSRFREIISILRSKSKESSLKKITQITKRVRKSLYAKEIKSCR